MNNSKGAVIIIATKPMQVYLYDKAMLQQLSDYQTILVIDQTQENRLDLDYLACFDKVYYVKNAGTVDIFALHDIQTIRQIVNQYSQLYGPEKCFVFTTDEGNVERIAKALDGLHAFSEDFRYANIFRDKVKMKAHVAKYGIRVPIFKSFSPDLTYAELEKQMGSTLIIKPVDSAGAVDVVKIHNESEYQFFLAGYTGKAHYQVEEFIDGTLYHVDSVKKDKKIAAYSISEYLYPVKEFTNGLPLASFCLDAEDKHYNDIKKFNQSVLDAFPIDGSFHAEYFVTPSGEIVFLEIAYRQAGMPVHLAFKNKTGHWQSALYLGLAMDLIKPDNIQYHSVDQFLTYIPSENGRYHKLNIPLATGQYQILAEPKIGQQCTQPQSCFDKMAEIVVKADDHSQLYQHFQAIRQQGKMAVFSS